MNTFSAIQYIFWWYYGRCLGW